MKSDIYLGRFFTPVFLLLLCLLTYANSLNNPFIMDDLSMIISNPGINDLGFRQLDFFGYNQANYSGSSYLYFRPVYHGLIFIAHSVFSTNQFAYHVLNLCLFFFCTIILFELIYFLFQNKELALLTSALFCTHPINGIYVNYMNTSGLAVLIFSTLLSLKYGFQSMKSKKRYQWLSLLFFAMALSSHEVGIIVPFIFFATTIFLKDYSLKNSIKILTPQILLVIIYMIFRLEYASLQSGVLDHIQHFNISLFSYIASLGNLVLFHFHNLVTANDIVLFWATPIIENNLMLWMSVLLIVLVSWYVLVFHRLRNAPEGLGLLWMAVGFFPLSLAAFSRPLEGFLISPHWVYMVSVGYCVFLAALFLRLTNKKLALVLLTILLLAQINASHRYNRLWSSGKSYTRHMLSLNPNFWFPTGCLADIYLRERNFDAAKTYYNRTIRGVYSDWMAYANLGLIEDLKGNKSEAARYYMKSIDINPRSAANYNNVATILIEQKKYTQAKKFLNKALSLDPYISGAKENLESILMSE